jgi:hypothetical protein
MLPIVAGLAACGTKVGTVAVTYAPQILTAGGVASILVGGGLLIKDTPGYIEIWEEMERGEKTKAETATAVIKKAAIPAALILSGTLWIGVGLKISLERAAVAAFGTGVLTKEVDELKVWKHEAEKVLGEDKTKEVNKKAKAKTKESYKHAIQDPDLDAFDRKGVYASTAKGGGPWVGCKEACTSIQFKIPLEALGDAVKKAATIMNREYYITLNQWLECLGLPVSPIGNQLCIRDDECYELKLEDDVAEMDCDGIYALRVINFAGVDWKPVTKDLKERAYA